MGFCIFLRGFVYVLVFGAGCAGCAGCAGWAGCAGCVGLVRLERNRETGLSKTAKPVLGFLDMYTRSL